MTSEERIKEIIEVCIADFNISYRFSDEKYCIDRAAKEIMELHKKEMIAFAEWIALTYCQADDDGKEGPDMWQVNNEGEPYKEIPTAKLLECFHNRSLESLSQIIEPAN